VSDGTRTRGRLDHNQELYQLSYAHRATLNLAAAGPCDHPPMSFELGDRVPAFTLDDTEGTAHAVPADPAPPATVLVVTCNHCPYVIAWNPRLRAVAEDYAPRDVRFLAINANDAARYPADSPAAMQRFVADQSWPIPYLYDESQDVARALDAQVTPHVFVLDGEQRLRYRGAPDADHGDPSQNAQHLRDALDAVLAGDTPDPADTRPRGCSVKWKG
jgi:peroxiredoxin